jgi:hypothetical protein
MSPGHLPERAQPHVASALPRTWRRRAAFAALIGAVVALHAVATRELGDALARSADGAMPERMAVAYVRTIEPEAPSAVAPGGVALPASRSPRALRAPREPAPAASAPLPAEVTPTDAATPETGAQTASHEEGPPAASPPGSGEDGSAPSTEILAASPPGGAVPFVWPASTRVSYALTGFYRGDVSGTAQVEWIRADDGRYQVHLDIAAGPDFAPLVTRRMTSEGRIGEHGLAPERYDEDTQVVFRSTRRVRMLLDPLDVALADGKRVPRPAGVQDTASQFVQLTYLFSMEPQRLREGASVEMPLALPKSVDIWTYDVVGRQDLQTPFGPVETFHLKPRRTSRPNGELTAEVWIAPSLRYLPVRIRIRQTQENWADLVIDRKPELAGPADPSAMTSKEETPRP